MYSMVFVKKITKVLPEEGSVMILASLTFLFLNICFDNWYMKSVAYLARVLRVL